MNGIEILNTIPLTQASSGSVIATIIFFILCFIILILIVSKSDVMAGANKKDKWIASCVCSMLCTMFLTLFFYCVIGMIWTEPTGEYRYQVTIDKSVSMTEFDGEYVIIKQEGKIYTIEEK